MKEKIILLVVKSRKMNSHVLFILSLILSLCIFSSCKVVGYSDGLNHLSSKERNNIQIPYSSIDSLKNNGKIYKINVGQLKQALNNKKDAIVYEFIIKIQAIFILGHDVIARRS